MMAGVRGLVLALVLGLGCARPLPDVVREDLRIARRFEAPRRIDVGASVVDLEVDVAVSDEGYYEGEALRAEVAEVLDLALAQRDWPSAPTRFRVLGRLSHQGWIGVIPCLGVLILAGCPSKIGKADITLELEVGGKRQMASGQGSAIGGLYYQGNAAGVALARALAEAVAAMGPGAAP